MMMTFSIVAKNTSLLHFFAAISVVLNISIACKEDAESFDDIRIRFDHRVLDGWFDGTTRRDLRLLDSIRIPSAFGKKNKNETKTKHRRHETN